MTWSAPNERIKCSLPVLSTPVTSAPYNLASCTANVPAPPPAPLIKTFCPGWTCPLSRIPCRAITAACGMAATSSNVILAGFSAKALSRAWAEVTIRPNSPPRLVLVSCPIPRDSHVAAPFSQADFSARGSARRSPFHRAFTPGSLELSGTHDTLHATPRRGGRGRARRHLRPRARHDHLAPHRQQVSYSNAFPPRSRA